MYWTMWPITAPTTVARSSSLLRQAGFAAPVTEPDRVSERGRGMRMGGPLVRHSGPTMADNGARRSFGVVPQ